MIKHSMVDVITNSSSVSYVYPSINWKSGLVDFLNNILKDSGVEDVNAEDVFEFSYEFDDQYYVENALEMYADGNDSYRGYGQAPSTAAKEQELVAEFVKANNIDVEQSLYEQKDKYDINDLVAKFNEALNNGELVVDGYDEMFYDARYTTVKVKSKITGREFDLTKEIESFMDHEGGNDNY